MVGSRREEACQHIHVSEREISREANQANHGKGKQENLFLSKQHLQVYTLLYFRKLMISD